MLGQRGAGQQLLACDIALEHSELYALTYCYTTM